jgi:enamine deaminase RidA (YjgF/YER057c/UK114 family)
VRSEYFAYHHFSGAVLEAGGSSLAKAVKVNVFLANMDDFAAVNEVYAKFFPDPKPVSLFFRFEVVDLWMLTCRYSGSHMCCREDFATQH